jgi:hypothetical protein
MASRVVASVDEFELSNLNLENRKKRTVSQKQSVLCVTLIYDQSMFPPVEVEAGEAT